MAAMNPEEPGGYGIDPTIENALKQSEALVAVQRFLGARLIQARSLDASSESDRLKMGNAASITSGLFVRRDINPEIMPGEFEELTFVPKPSSHTSSYVRSVAVRYETDVMPEDETLFCLELSYRSGDAWRYLVTDRIDPYRDGGDIAESLVSTREAGTHRGLRVTIPRFNHPVLEPTTLQAIIEDCTMDR